MTDLWDDIDRLRLEAERDEWKARAEKAESEVKRLVVELSDYVEVEEVNRDLVKRGDFWKARAEKAERQVRSLIHAAEVWKNRTISAEAALKGWEQSR